MSRESKIDGLAGNAGKGASAEAGGRLAMALHGETPSRQDLERQLQTEVFALMETVRKDNERILSQRQGPRPSTIRPRDLV